MVLEDPGVVLKSLWVVAPPFEGSPIVTPPTKGLGIVSMHLWGGQPLSSKGVGCLAHPNHTLVVVDHHPLSLRGVVDPF